MIIAKTFLKNKERVFIVLLVAVLLLAGLACVYTIKSYDNVSGSKTGNINQRLGSFSSTPEKSSEIYQGTLYRNRNKGPGILTEIYRKPARQYTEKQ
jgi:hypothetical protein